MPSTRLNRFAIVVAAGGAANRVLGCERPFLRIEGFSTSPKTGASHDQRDDEPVTPAAGGKPPNEPGRARAKPVAPLVVPESRCGPPGSRAPANSHPVPL